MTSLDSQSGCKVLAAVCMTKPEPTKPEKKNFRAYFSIFPFIFGLLYIYIFINTHGSKTTKP